MTKRACLSLTVENTYPPNVDDDFIAKEIQTVFEELRETLILGWVVQEATSAVYSQGTLRDYPLAPLSKNLCALMFVEMSRDVFNMFEMSDPVMYKVFQMARQTLGPERPYSNDDEEFHALCTQIIEKAFKHLAEVVRKGLKG